jgi:hypothetical protein
LILPFLWPPRSAWRPYPRRSSGGDICERTQNRLFRHSGWPARAGSSSQTGGGCMLSPLLLLKETSNRRRETGEIVLIGFLTTCERRGSIHAPRQCRNRRVRPFAVGPAVTCPDAIFGVVGAGLLGRMPVRPIVRVRGVNTSELKYTRCIFPS